MAFQTTISKVQGFGIIGQLYSDAPIVSETYILLSSTPSNNIFGRFFCTNGIDGQAVAGGIEGFSNFHMAGFLINTHHNASYGTQQFGVLDPTLTLSNGEEGEFLTRGFIYASVANGPSGVPRIGDYVFYDVTNGSLIAVNPNLLNPPVGYSFAHARIDEFDPDAAGLAVIEVINVPLEEFQNIP